MEQLLKFSKLANHLLLNWLQSHWDVALRANVYEGILAVVSVYCKQQQQVQYQSSLKSDIFKHGLGQTYK